MNNKKSIIYLTYDTNLHKFLKENGICDLLYGLHPKTYRMFWVYERDDNFNIMLSMWEKNK